MRNAVPRILVYSRIVIGLVCVFLACQVDDFRYWIFALMLTGLLTDIFDGIIARKLGVSTVALRKLDSLVDRFFWLMIFASCYLRYPLYTASVIPWVGIILLCEALVFLISWFRFKKGPSPHNLISKAWGISVAVAFSVIILTGSSQIAFQIMLGFAILSRFDSALIYIILPRWDHDIPSFYHAMLIRKGKSITRNSLLNG